LLGKSKQSGIKLEKPQKENAIMPYWVNCACGKSIEVTDTQAGAVLTCSCGKGVPVPRLSELRKQSSEIAFDASPEMVIRYVYGSGKEAVGGDACACCSGVPVDRVLCLVECEKPQSKGQHSWLFWIFMGLFSLPWAFIYYVVRLGQRLEMTEGKSFEFYLSLCSSCQKPALEGDLLRKIVCQEPAFARLFAKYPEAKVWTQ
jgi:hypothetical protein